MSKKLSTYVLLCLLIYWLVPVSAISQQQPESRLKRLKKRVAVFEFEDKTDHQVHWWTGQPVGRGMADMLTTALVKAGTYRVIERGAIEQIMKEQHLGLSGAVTAESAAQVGKLLGVELAVIGSVTEFGYKKGEVGGRVKGIGLGVQSSAASVGIDVRFINTTTGEILMAENVRKEKSKKGLAVDTEDFGFKDQNEFDESLVGKATREAIDQLVVLIDQQMAKVPWQAKVIKGGTTVFINSGAEAGVMVGDVFVVYRPGEELIDPDTGLSLGSVETKIGTIEVIDNNVGNGKASNCAIKDGSGFQTGDLVRLE
ncbi:MAG: CsgG/HfaB family protein [candidate division KSB1 bacterium]|nr:CsgG/HfaB family protein [candidate division KSB1 bacterium]